MKQPTFRGRELLPLSVIEAARAGDPLAVERVLRYYEATWTSSVPGRSMIWTVRPMCRWTST